MFGIYLFSQTIYQMMFSKAEKIAEYIKKHDKVKVVSHIDADGIASASIASAALERAGIERKIEFIKQLDETVIEKLKKETSVIWFTDLGSGVSEYLKDLDCIITDHHKPNAACKKGSTLLAFYNSQDEFHLNPHFYQKDGSGEISGAGVTYIVAKAMDERNAELSALAVVGAVGDLQDSANGKLIGMNRDILEDGRRAELLEWYKDIRFFGRETRPVFKLLQYATDPIIPTLTGSEENCIQFLYDLGIKMKVGEHWKFWIDLMQEEKQKIISEIVFLLLSKGFGYKNAMRVVGEVYVLKKEIPGSELHDVKEFATLLNACGRYDKAEIGYKVCTGDRGEYLLKARSLLQTHRKTLVDSIQFVTESGITERSQIQYFHALDSINEKVVGIVAGMVLASGTISREKPLIAFANTDDGKQIKVSARGTRELVSKGLDLAVAVGKAAQSVGGIGGGHDIAAGATIPKGCEEEFLAEIEKVIKQQLDR